MAPGNAGTALEAELDNVDIGAEDIDALLEFAQQQRIELTIVGPEAPLVAGVVDRFQAAGLRIFGPSAAAAELAVPDRAAQRQALGALQSALATGARRVATAQS